MSDYRAILKSTVLIGSTQIVVIILGIIRTKALALLLGPAGVGLVGMYQSTIDLIGTVTGLGISRAGVRQIAAANGAKDEQKIILTSRTLRLLSLGSGLLGMLVVLLFSYPISKITFGNHQFVLGISIASVVLLFNSISAGQLALLQGLRRLKDMAKCQILGALFGTVASVGVVYIWGDEAVVWFLVAISFFSVLTSWWFVRRYSYKFSQIPGDYMLAEARVLVQTGFAFMVSGVVTASTMYITRVFVINELGMTSVGLYSAAITLSSIYVNIILQAMISDYYPRLSAVANDNKAINKMVNEQTEMSLLMGTPGVLGMITLAPWVLSLFYTQEFSSASTLIRWLILGVGLQLISWPIGLILPAKGLSRMMIIADTTRGVVQVISLIFCIRLWGLEGIGISFVIANAGYVLMILLIANNATSFLWSRSAKSIIGVNCFVIFMVWLIVLFMPFIFGIIVGLSVTAVSSVLCFLIIKKRAKNTLHKSPGFFKENIQ